MRTLVAMITAFAVFAIPSAASAKHHKHRVHRADPVVASGTTLFGLPWQATAQPTGQIQFSVDSRAKFRQGWLERLSLPGSPSVFTAQVKTGIDPRPEGELAGVTDPTVALLDVHMSDGSILEIYPTPAPPAAQSRLPWLNQVQVFAGFFPSGAATPETITAFDSNNDVLAERGASDGRF
jgi:hypothetical protein